MTLMIKQLVLILSAYCCYVQCCSQRFIYADDGEILCTSVESVNEEGNGTWSFVRVDNEPRILNLKKDMFTSTPNLEKLVINFFGQIEEGTFNGLSQLDELEFYKHKKSVFPLKVLDGLPIRRLTMNDMDMTEILPGLFHNLPDLGILSINGNLLTEIRQGVFSNTTILKIYCQDSQITYIEPNSFANIPELLQLGLAGNLLTSFNSEEIFGSTSDTVNRIWLEKNRIKRIEKHSFSAFPYLTQLSLYLNEIEFIEKGAFENNPVLYSLDLSNNKLTELYPAVFPGKGLPKLTYLFLYNNKLTFLRMCILRKLPNLQYISLELNPLQCACLKTINKCLNRKNVTRICDDHLDLSDRASCVTYNKSPMKCVYNSNLSKDIYDMYLEVNKDSPVIVYGLNDLCNFS